MISEKNYHPAEKPKEDDIYELYDEADKLIEALKKNDRTNKLTLELDDFLDKDDKEGIRGIIRQAEEIFGKTIALEKNLLFNNERFAYGKNLSIEDVEKLKQAEPGVMRLAVESNFLGSGRTAKVYKNEEYPSYCFKIIYGIREYIDHDNDVKKEFEIMEKIQELQVAGIRIPKVHSFHMTKTMHFLLMENIHGHNLEEILEGKVRISGEIDWKKLFDNLKEFIQAMNDQGVYHKDLVERNIMYDLDSGNLVVIDFGRSKCSKIYESSEERDADNDLNGILEIRKKFQKKFGKG